MYVHVITYPLYSVAVTAASAVCCNAVDCGRYLCGWYVAAAPRSNTYCSPRYLVYDTDVCMVLLLYYIDVRVMSVGTLLSSMSTQRKMCQPSLCFPKQYPATAQPVMALTMRAEYIPLPIIFFFVPVFEQYTALSIRPGFCASHLSLIIMHDIISDSSAPTARRNPSLFLPHGNLASRHG